MAVLKALRSRLTRLQSTLRQHEQRVAASKEQKTGAEASNSDQENDNDAVNAVGAPVTATAAATTVGCWERSAC